MMTARNILRTTLATAALAISASAGAQGYPAKSVRIIVPAAVGGQSDITARLLSNELSKRLNGTFVVDNRTGAGGLIGMQNVASADPDGYTLLFGGVLAGHPIFNANTPVDAAKAYAPVSNTLTGAYFFIESSKLPAKLPDLVSWSKANAGKLNFGSPGSAIPELLVKMVQLRTGLDTTVIPFAGASQVITSILNGEVGITMQSIGPYIPQVRAGTVRVMFVTTGKRSSLQPDVPTAAEVGISNYDIGFHNGLWAPAGTPRDVIQRLSREAAAVPKMPEIAEKIRTAAGADPDGTTPEEQLAAFEAEIRFWGEAARAANYKPQ